MEHSSAVTNTLKNRFDGKLMAVLGDSLSAFEGHVPEGYAVNSLFSLRSSNVNRVEDMWWHIVARELGLIPGTVGAWAGSFVTPSINSPKTPESAMTHQSRIDAIRRAGTPDVIFFWGGTNDVYRCHTMKNPWFEVGEFTPDVADGVLGDDERNLESLAESYCRVLTRLKKTCPEAEIFCITPMETGIYTGTKCQYITSDGCDRVAGILREICDFYGVYFIDMRGCRTSSDREYADGLHPTLPGMRHIAEHILRELGKLFPDTEN